jgi:hypothetical protein
LLRSKGSDTLDPSIELGEKFFAISRLSESSGNLCAVCLDGLQVGDKVITLSCFHQFHFSCLDPWIKKQGNPSCPTCRRSIFSVDPLFSNKTGNNSSRAALGASLADARTAFQAGTSPTARRAAILRASLMGTPRQADSG